jgi:hypothetical protein
VSVCLGITPPRVTHRTGTTWIVPGSHGFEQNVLRTVPKHQGTVRTKIFPALRNGQKMVAHPQLEVAQRHLTSLTASAHVDQFCRYGNNFMTVDTVAL